jgi:hypothetical protein
VTFPDGLATTTVTVGPYLDGGGQPATGRVRFVPEGRVLHSPSGSVILPDAATVTLDGTGAGQVVLVASDAAGVTPRPFAYWVYWDLPGRSSPEPRRVFLPAGTADIDALLPVTSGTGPIAAPAVSSVAGLSGAVSATDLADAIATQPALGIYATGDAVAAAVDRSILVVTRSSPFTAPTGFQDLALPTVESDSAAAYDPATGRYTIPVTADYDVLASVRRADGAAPAGNKNLGIGVDAVGTNDSPYFSWFPLSDSLRQGFIYNRTRHFAAGTVVRMFIFGDNAGDVGCQAASLSIVLVRK